MAGTMPHAIFIETNADGGGGVAAYAAEVPGCAVFAASDEDAATAMPGRVQAFMAWLASRGEPAPPVIGDNWYEVERAAAEADSGALRRASFSLDELSPSDEEFERWLRWLELAREELAEALDATAEIPPGVRDAVGDVAAQDLGMARVLGWTADVAPVSAADDPFDRLYLARDVLTDALVAAGPSADGVRRVIRLAIADDLHLVDRLAGSGG
jgi:hypothetical protein